MQVPRDLSKRMVEAVEQTPVVDVYERLWPESRRISQRHDLISWILAYAGEEIGALGLQPEELTLLGNVKGDPDERWRAFSRCWPPLKTTGKGRAILRAIWDLFGAQEVNERTWKEVSAQLWQVSKEGFYQELLQQRAHISMALVEGAMDPRSRSCCAPVSNCARFFAIRNRAELDALASELGEPCAAVEQMDVLVEKSIQADRAAGCCGFLVGSSLPDAGMPNQQEIRWAFDRVFRRDTSSGSPEPALQSHLLHRLLALVGQTGLPLLVHVGGDAEVARLGTLAVQYPLVRFVGVYGGQGDALRLATLARGLPNLTLALGDLWCAMPRRACSVLADWIQAVPLCKLFAFSGGTAMVEAVFAHVQIARGHVAALFAEMITEGLLDEQDALWAIRRVLNENAREHFRLAF